MSLFNVMSISASGLAAQRARAEVVTENLANAETTRTPEGGPYRRKEIVFTAAPADSPFSAVFQTELGRPGGVAIADLREDGRDPEKRYEPGHPQADQDGYVAYPGISPAEEMVDLMGAARGYQANAAALSAVKDMVARSIDLLR